MADFVRDSVLKTTREHPKLSALNTTAEDVDVDFSPTTGAIAVGVEIKAHNLAEAKLVQRHLGAENETITTYIMNQLQEAPDIEDVRDISTNLGIRGFKGSVEPGAFVNFTELNKSSAETEPARWVFHDQRVAHTKEIRPTAPWKVPPSGPKAKEAQAKKDQKEDNIEKLGLFCALIAAAFVVLLAYTFGARVPQYEIARRTIREPLEEDAKEETS